MSTNVALTLRNIAFLLSAALGICAASLVQAQNPLRIVAQVNNGAITQHELDQRILLLDALGTRGDLEQEALERLIEERLQLQAAKRAGITLTPEEIAGGVDEFAQRAEMSGDQFLIAIQQEGVDAQSFRQFVSAGLSWRNLVRDRFGRFGVVSDFEIDRAVALEGTIGGARVLISEIFLPINTPENQAISADLAPQIQKLKSISEFADAARRFSAGPSRERGGRVETWIQLQDLPAPVRAQILSMKPGEVTDPFDIPNAIALFQLRALEETVAPAPKNQTVDYAIYHIPGGRSPATLTHAAQLIGQIDKCDDLYGIARKQPPEVLERTSQPVSQIPRDIALALAKLDVGESSTELTSANNESLLLVMLCGRSATREEEPPRDSFVQVLRNERLTAFADNYLDELRAEAMITLR